MQQAAPQDAKIRNALENNLTQGRRTASEYAPGFLCTSRRVALLWAALADERTLMKVLSAQIDTRYD